MGSHVATPPQDDIIKLTSDEIVNMRMAVLAS